MSTCGPVAVLIASGLALGGAVAAAERSLPITDVSAIYNPEGEARILFRLQGLDALYDVAVGSAKLTVPFTLAAPQDRVLEFRVMPVTRDWTAGGVDWNSDWNTPGGDFDDRVYARGRVDLRSRTGVLSFDLTPALLEYLEAGADYHGFLVTARPQTVEGGEGIEPSDLVLLQGLGTATVRVTYRELLGGWGGDRRGRS